MRAQLYASTEDFKPCATLLPSCAIFTSLMCYLYFPHVLSLWRNVVAKEPVRYNTSSMIAAHIN